MRPIDADALMDDIKRDTKKAIDEGDKAGSFWLGYAAGSVIVQPTIQPEQCGDKSYTLWKESYEELKRRMDELTSCSDIISRQAAIDSLDCINGVEEVLRSLPGVQPEQQHGRVFKGIVVEYYPSYNTHPEYKGKPYFSIKYTEKGQSFIGYGTYNPEVLSEYLKEYFMPSAQPEPHWIPVSERLPEIGGEYLVSVRWYREDDIDIDVYDYDARCKEWNDGESCGQRVIAWMPLPEPYKPNNK